MSGPSLMTLAICSGGFLLSLVGVLLARGLSRRQYWAALEGIAWQLEKMRRVSNGWRPALWDQNDPTVTEDEKVAAIRAYAQGKPIPPSGAEARARRLSKGVTRW